MLDPPVRFYKNPILTYTVSAITMEMLLLTTDHDVEIMCAKGLDVLCISIIGYIILVLGR